MKTTYTILLMGLAAQQATATWDFFGNFPTPKYSENECSDKQKGGFDWSDLLDGASVGVYGDFDFSGGWTCANSFGKRDALSKRTFGNKCIKNSVAKEKPASFGCNKRGFSITHMDISAEFDVELELHYTMEDGSKCKQLGSCSAGGSTLQNTQCGGAKSVDVYLGSHYKGDKDSCEIGFHNIGFDCTPEIPYTTPALPQVPATYTPVKASSSVVKSVATPPASSKVVATPTGGYPSSTPEAKTSAYKTTETPSKSVPVSSPAPFGNSSAPAYTPQVPASVSSTVATYPAKSSTPASKPVALSSAAAGCGYGESCGESSVASSSTMTPEAATSSAAPKPSSPSYPSYPTTPSPPVNLTDVVPKCMNSWLQISASGCKDNTDSNCYCVKPEFTKNVIDCITARCGNDDDTSKALQYFIGICADHVPKNPQIIGDCPSGAASPPAAPKSSSVAPSAAAPSPSAPVAASSPSGPGYPVETPSVPAAGQTPAMTPPAAAAPPPAESTPCTTITYGTTTLTVPQVHFTTPMASGNAPNPTAPVALVPALRPSSPAQFTGAASAFTIVPKSALFGAVLAFLAL
ncbi:CFEM multi-domain protein [Pyrenophora tritici-repentis]|nr:CFEM multi-domain protein [Pyrenophora tritici-repentis]KAI1552036.1 extracellular serine-threonine rich protein [Pyrenophora tritici-repentis]KAI1587136.1 extracellular serine-threonine rich protein [Pyrenophora tritici-repentis]KAI1606699.1 extracellular serine-threonine rich protein [Pyrenophora tritici-repentis]PZC96429.1 CFEM domain containing protein [Pyrenophora tritici-repentis]